jgi:hypothetical protein
MSDRPCFDGCGEYPVGKDSRYIPGHDAHISTRVLAFADARGIETLDELLRRYEAMEAGVQ